MKARSDMIHGWATCSVSAPLKTWNSKARGLPSSVVGAMSVPYPFGSYTSPATSPLGQKKSCSTTVSPANSRTLYASYPYGHSIPRTCSNSPRS